jgi:hypothetical protein
MQQQIDAWAEYGSTSRPAASLAKAKGKEAIAARKAAKGIEDEQKLAESVAGLMEAVEKEDAVSPDVD